MTKHFFTLLLALPLLLICSSANNPTNQTYRFNYENVLGTSLELKVNSRFPQSAAIAEQQALDEIDRLNNILSTYKVDSEISHWLKTFRTEEKISPELFEVLALFDQWKERTHGALNASSAIASDLWRKAESKQQLPDQEKLVLTLFAMHQPQWCLNPGEHTAIHLSHEPLALNSFVKGYIIQKVSEKVIGVSGVSGAVINIGGDINVIGTYKEIIGVANPSLDAENRRPKYLLRLEKQAIATSGNYRRGFQIGHQWFSHILDVRTAMPVTEIISASVISKDATVAGALATAFNILSIKESEELAASMGADYQIITRTGEEFVSEGWKEFISEDKNTEEEGPFEVQIDLELARFEGRFRRPFVAVWVENKKKESVRTVTLWFNKPRWLPDLNRWYSKNQSITHDYNAMGSISSATRVAGKYTLVWDGLDDLGKAVPPGKYTIYIEAAREHGTHQLLTQEINWNGKSIHYDLEGGVEIIAASVDLHQKATN
jgi:FAD:protein FMN transferase